MSAPDPIIPPDPITANVDFRYDGLYQSMVLVLLQRMIDATGGGGTNPQLQEILDELIELNSKASTEVTLQSVELNTNRVENLLSELMQEQKRTNKILRKIGNDE